MILRKPYAFFIKYFKLIHFIMAILMLLLLVQTNSFLSFFNEYINSNDLVLGQDVVSEIFNNISYIYILLIVLIDAMIWVLMDFKKKKRLFYSLNFVGFILMAVLYTYMSGTLVSMNEQIVDIRLLMVLRDLSIISFFIQSFFLFVTIIRTLGINVKQFDFQSDLKDLQLLESDNEEFEVNLEFDHDKLMRSIRTTIRNFRYYVKENVRIILPIVLAIAAFLGLFVYKNTKGLTTTYHEDQIVSYPDYSIAVKETYITNKDYKSDYVTDDSVLVVLKTQIKATNNKSVFEFGRFSLRIGDNKYYHNIKYIDYVKDIGNGYIKQKLTNDYTEYLLVFEIPESLANENMNLVYVNDISTGIFGQDKLTVISLNPQNLDVEPEVIGLDLNKNLSFEDGIIGNFQLLLESVELSDLFKIKYEYNLKNTDETYEFYEPLQAGFYGSYDKGLLKIKINFTTDNSQTISALNYIQMYGNLEYIINDKTKTIDIQRQVLPSRVKSNSFYFEIPYEVLRADDIKLKLITRKKIYVYDVK